MSKFLGGNRAQRLRYLRQYDLHVYDVQTIANARTFDARCVLLEDRHQRPRANRPGLALFILAGYRFVRMSRMRVQLHHNLQQRICQQMEAAYPNEGGGFLLGSAQSEHLTIQDITQVENVFAAEEQHHRYAMTPQDWMRLEDEADSRGLTLIGYYHSHPDSPAIPSLYDRDHALPNFVYLITSVQDGQAVDMRVWRLRADRSEFDALTLNIHDT
jgi:proteasome lid subunit RPN8/RPN11